MKQESCYYAEYGVCTYSYSDYSGKTCPGAGKCPKFISETAYFAGTMDGTIRETRDVEERRMDRERALKNLKKEKTKKQLKREEKLAAEKNKVEGGVALGDNPAFQEIMKKLNGK